MGHVRVNGADLEGGRIRTLRVTMHGLPARTIDRDTAIAWLREGHSLVVDGTGQALHIVEVPTGDAVLRFVRFDNAPTAEDALPALPSAAGT